ncbi:MAG: GNAT family N-acetyltransferase [Candidatus Neomarinimicrobiota bacterium]|tara:strand:- start:251 stop:736 length:486 start_codon:yes stop_codon:yes gene_type:complete
MEIKIEKVSYQNKKNSRILEAVLTNWFRNPKELNLVDPTLSYPFRYNKWVALNYLNPEIHTIVIKLDQWIVGIGSMYKVPNTKTVDIFHVYIDAEHRRQKLGKKILYYFESLSLKENVELITIRIMLKNIAAKALLNSEGYIQKEKQNRKISIFQKKLYKN